jgi:glyoxylase-like metal-dependent hydrolase (beta-lactamase superfamily II)
MIVLLLALLPLSPSLDAQTASEADVRAVALLEQTLARLGATNAPAAFDLSFAGSSVNFSAGQAWSPNATTSSTAIERRFVVDTAGGRARRESISVFPGPITFDTLAIYRPDGAWSVDRAKWRTGTDLQRVTAEQSKQTLAVWTRMLPHTAVRQALAARETLKSEPRTTRDGRAVDVVTYSDPAGAAVTLFIDVETGLPVASTPGEFPGTAFEYSEYRPVDGVQVPHHWVMRGTTVVEDHRVVRVDVRPALTDALFSLPAGYTEPPSSPTPRATKVAPNVYRLDDMPRGYHTAFIVQEDGVAVFDAPQNAQFSETTLKLIRETVGEKPVRRVLVSHHHSDHVGGLAVFVTAGAAIVTTPSAQELFRKQLPEALRAGVRFELVDESMRTLGSGAMRIDAYRVPNEHAESSLLFHLPAQKVLLQGDLFYVPDRGPVPPAFAVTADLERIIEFHKLEANVILAVHGRSTTFDEMRESLAKRSGTTTRKAPG